MSATPDQRLKALSNLPTPDFIAEVLCGEAERRDLDLSGERIHDVVEHAVKMHRMRSMTALQRTPEGTAIIANLGLEDYLNACGIEMEDRVKDRTPEEKTFRETHAAIVVGRMLRGLPTTTEVDEEAAKEAIDDATDGALNLDETWDTLYNMSDNDFVQVSRGDASETPQLWWDWSKKLLESAGKGPDARPAIIGPDDAVVGKPGGGGHFYKYPDPKPRANVTQAALEAAARQFVRWPILTHDSDYDPPEGVRPGGAMAPESINPNAQRFTADSAVAVPVAFNRVAIGAATTVAPDLYGPPDLTKKSSTDLFGPVPAPAWRGTVPTTPERDFAVEEIAAAYKSHMPNMPHSAAQSNAAALFRILAKRPEERDYELLHPDNAVSRKLFEYFAPRMDGGPPIKLDSRVKVSHEQVKRWVSPKPTVAQLREARDAKQSAEAQTDADKVAAIDALLPRRATEYPLETLRKARDIAMTLSKLHDREAMRGALDERIRKAEFAQRVTVAEKSRPAVWGQTYAQWRDAVIAEGKAKYPHATAADFEHHVKLYDSHSDTYMGALEKHIDEGGVLAPKVWDDVLRRFHKEQPDQALRWFLSMTRGSREFAYPPGYIVPWERITAGKDGAVARYRRSNRGR